MRRQIKVSLIAAATFVIATCGAIKVYADFTAVTVTGNVTFCGKTTSVPNQANCMVPVEPTAGLPTTGGTMVTYLSAASTNSTSVKGSAGILLYALVINTTTTLGDLRIYNSATAPTCSSATNLMANIPVQSNAVGPGVPLTIPGGAYASNGIGFCYTGANTNTDTTNAATGANIIFVYN